MARNLFAVVLAICIAIPASFLQAQSPEVQNLAWVQIEAHPSLARAKASIRRYTTELQDVNGFRLNTGWYAVALGPYTPEDAERARWVYLSERAIPGDSYIARSSDFRQQFWPVGANMLNRSALNAPASATAAGIDTPDADPDRIPEPTVVALPADENLREARQNERLLTRQERAELQVALKWAGVYDGQIDASFGRGTRRAMERWQDANNFEPTGVLTTLQRSELFRQYNAVLEGLGLQFVRDETVGIEIKLPTAVVDFAKYEAPFAHYNPISDVDASILLISQEGDKDTLAGLFEIMQTLEIVPEEGPRTLEKDGFTLIGEGALIISFTQVWLQDGQIKGFTLLWPAGDEERRTRLLNEMQASFNRLDGVLDPSAGAPEEQSIDLMSGLEIRRPRLSRSGFFVNEDGTVVTTADVVANCRRITIDQQYDAEIAIQDEALGIAVLRPQEDLAPISVAQFQSSIPRLQSPVAVAGYSHGGILGAPTVTFGELADLRGLDGDTRVKRLALAPLSGDAGGPVIDAGGAVIGMLLPKPESERILPDDVSFAAGTNSVQEVLNLAKITVSTTSELERMTPEALNRSASDMTVLVSCWD